MDKLLKKLAHLSALSFSDEELLEFSKDFSDIRSFTDKINDFEYDDNEARKSIDFSDLRDDFPKACDFKANTNTVPRVIS